MIKTYYALTCLADWEQKESYSDKITLIKRNAKLFDIETEKWKYIGDCELSISNDKTFTLSGTLSMFDIEVLKSNKYKIK